MSFFYVIPMNEYSSNHDLNMQKKSDHGDKLMLFNLNVKVLKIFYTKCNN